ncbi:MAG: trypsin-like peptidase domain-containing protein, partial [Planctomycetes bacterium]|nr:trypsin-like peptidase domain-containing protein [Planctomycetota bacterium]
MERIVSSCVRRPASCVWGTAWRLLACAALSGLLDGGLVAQEPPAPPAAEPAPSQDPGIFARVDPSVVTISHERAMGSGFILSEDGYILTNGHVVMDVGDGEDPKAVSRRITVTLSDERKFQARVLGHNLDPDVALIKIDVGAERLSPVEIGDSRAVRVGQRCFAVGSPRGMRRTLTSGVLSNIERTDLGTFTTVLQTDAAINPGNSGGPLFDEQGRVLGLNTYADQRANNLGFTVPIHVAMVLQEHYRRHGYFRRAALPFFFAQETHDPLAAALGLPGHGVLLDFVEEGSSAWAAGLRSGDVIVRVDGKPCPARTRTDLLAFRWDLSTREVGSRVRLDLLQYEEGTWKPRAVEMELEEDTPAPAIGNQRGEIPEMLYQPLGLGVRRIVPLARYAFDLATDRGVLVT